MRIVAVHGNKLTRKGELTKENRLRLDRAREVFREKKCDFVIVLGGRTRDRFKCESEKAAEYLERFSIPVIKETKSLSSYENVKFLKEIVGNKAEKIFVILVKPKTWKVKFLYRKFFPEVYSRISFIQSREGFPLVETLQEFFFMPYQVFDSCNERFPAIIFQRFFRNGHR